MFTKTIDLQTETQLYSTTNSTRWSENSFQSDGHLLSTEHIQAFDVCSSKLKRNSSIVWDIPSLLVWCKVLCYTCTGWQGMLENPLYIYALVTCGFLSSWSSSWLTVTMETGSLKAQQIKLYATTQGNGLRGAWGRGCVLGMWVKYANKQAK